MSLRKQRSRKSKELVGFLNNVKKSENKPESLCENCQLTKNVKVCDICQKSFCSYCIKKYLKFSDFADQRKVDQGTCSLCYNCKHKILQTSQENNFIHEPSWIDPMEKINCEVCEKHFKKVRYTCCLCGMILCKKCSVVSQCNKRLYRNPFSNSIDNYLCHQCYFDFNSGKRLAFKQEKNKLIKSKFDKSIRKKDLTDAIYEIVRGRNPILTTKIVTENCYHCKRKTKYFSSCSLCSDFFCKMCVQHFRLPKEFDLFKDTKKNLNPVCYGCRNDIFLQKKQYGDLKKFHINANIDFVKKIIKTPKWDDPDHSFYCHRCSELLGSKKMICGLCGGIFCRNCTVKCSSPMNVFFNKFDVYNFNICFACRYYKNAGFKIEKSENTVENYKNLIEKRVNDDSTIKMKLFFEDKFNLKDQFMIDCFNCMRKKQIRIIGKMFISREYICFFSQIFDNVTKLKINLNSIEEIYEVGVIKNEFRIVVKNLENNSRKKYGFLFLSVFNSSKHLKLMKQLAIVNDFKFNTGKDNYPSKAKKKNKEKYISTTEKKEETFEILKEIKLKKVLESDYPISSTKFFDYFFSDESFYSIMDFYLSKGWGTPICSGWKESSKIGLSRSISFEVKMRGIPKFMKSITSDTTSAIRTEKIIQNSNSFSICAIIKTPDLPYGDNFQIFHLFCVKNVGDNACKLEVNYAMDFIKPIPFFQNKIAKQSFGENKESLKEFFSILRAKVDEIKPGDFKKNTNIKKKKVVEITKKRKISTSDVIPYSLLVVFLFTLLFFLTRR